MKIIATHSQWKLMASKLYFGYQWINGIQIKTERWYQVINYGSSAVEADAESAATLVTVVGLLKKLFWEQCAQRNA